MDEWEEEDAFAGPIPADRRVSGSMPMPVDRCDGDPVSVGLIDELVASVADDVDNNREEPSVRTIVDRVYLDKHIAERNAKIATLEADLAALRALVDARAVPEDLRWLSNIATPGLWTLEDMNGFVIGGCDPGQGPDDEVPEDWEPSDSGNDDLYPTAKLNAHLEGWQGDHDFNFMIAAVNFVRELIVGHTHDDEVERGSTTIPPEDH